MRMCNGDNETDKDVVVIFKIAIYSHIFVARTI